MRLNDGGKAPRDAGPGLAARGELRSFERAIALALFVSLCLYAGFVAGLYLPT